MPYLSSYASTDFGNIIVDIIFLIFDVVLAVAGIIALYLIGTWIYYLVTGKKPIIIKKIFG